MTATGPAYPRPHPFGSNAIGKFIIAVSPIGDIAPFDIWTTIISQYGNSPAIDGIIESTADAIDPTLDFQSFFDLIWNVVTAQGYGLDVWGRIVGVSRTIQIVGTVDYLGFEEAGDPGFQPFDTAPFFSGESVTSNFDLSDTAFRTLIFAKALSNICDGSIKAINQLLINLFPNRGNCFVRDNLDMTFTYVFQFVLSAVELAIVQTSGVLPKPTGVSFDVSQEGF